MLLVGPPARGTSQAGADPDDVRAKVEAAVAGGASSKDAVREVAALTGLPRNEVYRIALEGPVA